jgi:hypothetical protein
MTEHVTDDLELYALGALLEPAADRVTAHLATCPGCRDAFAELATVVGALPDMVALREPPAGLKERILAAAAADVAPTPAPRVSATEPTLRPNRRWLGLGALAAAVLVLVALDVNSLRELRSAEADLAQVARTFEKVAYGGRNWYMVGLDQWKGSGGTLYAPGKPDLSPYVVFHDLRPIAGDTLYAVWLVDPDGHWTRGANFRPDGRSVQSVDLTIPVDKFTQCAVTIETSTEGKKAGPVVMQSRIVPPAP